MSDRIQFRQSGEWTMVYLNGELVRSGDHYLADEWLQEHVGVEVVYDEAGICIPDGHTALRTLAEVEEAERVAAARAHAAEEKRAEARRLMAEADTIEAGG